MTSLSQTQYAIMVALGLLSACLSFLGSTLIVASILKRKKLRDTLHQLLFGLSLADILASALSATVAFVIPSTGEMGGVPIDPSLAPYAVGNYYTCSIWAFLYYFVGMVTCFYNFFVSFHFWMCVRSARKATTQAHQKRWAQLTAHTIAVSVPLVLTVLPLTVKQTANPFIFNTYPMVCYFDLSEWGGLRLRAFLTTLLALLSTGFTISLTHKVRSNLKRSQKYTGGHSTENREWERREKKVARQALWYYFAYLNSFAPVLLVLVYKSIVEVTGNEGAPGTYAVMVIMYFFGPLQGALNFIVFVLPRYQAWKELLQRTLQQEQKFNNNGALTRQDLAALQLLADSVAAAPATMQPSQGNNAAAAPPTSILSNCVLSGRILYYALFEEMPALTSKKRRDTLMQNALQNLPDISVMSLRFSTTNYSSRGTWPSVASSKSGNFQDHGPSLRSMGSRGIMGSEGSKIISPFASGELMFEDSNTSTSPNGASSSSGPYTSSILDSSSDLPPLQRRPSVGRATLLDNDEEDTTHFATPMYDDDDDDDLQPLQRLPSIGGSILDSDSSSHAASSCHPDDGIDEQQHLDQQLSLAMDAAVPLIRQEDEDDGSVVDCESAGGREPGDEEDHPIENETQGITTTKTVPSPPRLENDDRILIDFET